MVRDAISDRLVMQHHLLVDVNLLACTVEVSCQNDWLALSLQALLQEANKPHHAMNQVLGRPAPKPRKHATKHLRSGNDIPDGCALHCPAAKTKPTLLPYLAELAQRRVPLLGAHALHAREPRPVAVRLREADRPCTRTFCRTLASLPAESGS